MYSDIKRENSQGEHRWSDNHVYNIQKARIYLYRLRYIHIKIFL